MARFYSVFVGDENESIKFSWSAAGRTKCGNQIEICAKFLARQNLFQALESPSKLRHSASSASFFF